MDKLDILQENARMLIQEHVSNVGNKVISHTRAQTEQVDKFNQDSSKLVFKTKFSNSNNPHFSRLVDNVAK